MSVERTLMLVKPDAVRRNLEGKIIAHVQEKGFKLVALKKLKLTKEQAQQFYIVHKDRPFYDELCEFMSSGPIVAMVWEGENAISRIREIMGATNPEEAEEGTLRKLYGTNVGENAVHGSDSPESAKVEIPFFFSRLEIVE
ncbi:MULTISPECIES: nucleoside-diphosphate kinase [Persephonella]|uniref:Nucleoside diphosphate kinase n=1 Tax=Persephonella marina (strain DSM 14350 / EX-H1) TaxID=123214 RepID=NDK_PERMH|nr:MULTISPECIES: nucleoside-diphosphate kinase [Persephonella]C0QS47.1 RecName: Full=Nucleoside diphosphate kinase; Short=NDK; Short=NDP kinase; AltName: Full=Nucleoside-2-P kinase [Persephonella marina EX-H1]ACO04170.1 nucleoside diphosphate kinase [Persephonella marina EX-H1]